MPAARRVTVLAIVRYLSQYVPKILGLVLSPAAEMEGFFQEAGLPVEDPAHPPTPPPPDLERFLAISRKYHIENLLPTE